MILLFPANDKTQDEINRYCIQLHHKVSSVMDLSEKDVLEVMSELEDELERAI